MTSKAKDSYGGEAVEPGAETHEQDCLLDSNRGDKIRRRAYEIYLERGSEPGRELEDWLQAERELTTDADQSSNRPLAGKAVTYKALGGPEVIEIVERTVRAPAAGEVRIEVKAAGVNRTDILFRDPGFGDQFGGDTFPIVPGMDAAGIIESVGPGVLRLRVGEKVMAAVMPVRPEGGAQAQHIVVPAASVVPIPEGVSLAGAATLPMNGLTALRALELAALEKGADLGRERWRWLYGSLRDRGRETAGNKGHCRRHASRCRAGTQLRRGYRGRARTRLRRSDPPGAAQWRRRVARYGGPWGKVLWRHP
jgi:hypothetical protein